MVNERKTEALVRSRLRRTGYLDDSDVSVEEQKSESPRIDKMLQRASNLDISQRKRAKPVFFG